MTINEWLLSYFLKNIEFLDMKALIFQPTSQWTWSLRKGSVQMTPWTVLLINALPHLVPVIPFSHVSIIPFCLIPFLHPLIFSSPIRRKVPSSVLRFVYFSLQSPHKIPHTINLYFSLPYAVIFCHDFEIKLKSFSWTSDPNYQLGTWYIYLSPCLKGSSTWIHINSFKPALPLFC